MDKLCLQFELCTDILNAKYQDMFAESMIHINEAYLNSQYLTESSFETVYEAETEKVKEKTDGFFKKLIEAIGTFFSNLGHKVKTNIDDEKTKKALEELDKADLSKLPKEKVSMYKDEVLQKLLNDYVQELLVLEREIMDLKLDVKINMSTKSNKNHSLELLEASSELRKLEDKIDKLNERYNKELLESSEAQHIIELAQADAIRFSKEQLKSVKVNFDKVEKGSKKVLMQISKDAKGCEVPYKAKLLQKLGNGLATILRKIVYKRYEYTHKNLKTILKLGAAAAATAGIVFLGKSAMDGSLKSGIENFKDIRKKIDDAKKAQTT